MLRVQAVLCILGILAVFSLAVDARYKRGSITADHRCYNDDQCIKRGHDFCSFASAEQRDGIDVGWCKTGLKSGVSNGWGSKVVTAPPPLPPTRAPVSFGWGKKIVTTTPPVSNGWGSKVVTAPPPPAPPTQPPVSNGWGRKVTQPPVSNGWGSGAAAAADGRCWWSGCQHVSHAYKCPAATTQVENSFAACQNAHVNVKCCRND